MSKLLMLLITATIAFTSIASNTDPGFNYRKHYKKAKKKRTLDRMFNRNNCWGKSYYNIR
jgi:hypothetical protein